MPNMILLYDTPASRQKMEPLSWLRPLGQLWWGTRTLQQAWQGISGKQVYCLSTGLLSQVGEASMQEQSTGVCIDACLAPTTQAWQCVRQLAPGEALMQQGRVLAVGTVQPAPYGSLPAYHTAIEAPAGLVVFHHPIDLVMQQPLALRQQFDLFYQPQLPPTGWGNTLVGKNVYLGAGADVKACVLNTSEGPIVIEEGSLVMEGSLIRGPAFIGSKAVVKMGTQVYGGTSVGPRCTVGGELKNSILMEGSNKAHHGYLGDSYIGTWCNLGAGTSNSNVKNNAGSVTLWQGGTDHGYTAGIKAGTIMGDHSRTAINTSLNTGTVVGICCSIHQPGLSSKYIPSFAWGPGQTYHASKAVADAAAWKALKNEQLSEQEKQLILNAFNHNTA
ncbi:MAG: sugar-1-phosphate guanyl transferase [Chitinophagaceae bacterium]|nr:sugar-1-phosphate guanyl transferase [Chitinophagaceae bacterium]